MPNPPTLRKAKRSAKGADQDKAPGRNGKRASSGPKIALIVVVAVAVVILLVAAALANSSSPGLDVKKGDRLQYMIESYESKQNSTGSMVVEVTNTTTTSFEVTYAITLQNKTTKTVVNFPGASGGWGANIGEVMNKLSGSSSPVSVSNQTTLYTVYGAKSAIGYTITSTTQSGTGLYYEYWLDATNKCPYLTVLQYANGDAVTCTLLYTNIAEFQT
jgi:hypothetical protein